MASQVYSNLHPIRANTLLQLKLLQADNQSLQVQKYHLKAFLLFKLEWQ